MREVIPAEALVVAVEVGVDAALLETGHLPEHIRSGRRVRRERRVVADRVPAKRPLDRVAFRISNPQPIEAVLRRVQAMLSLEIDVDRAHGGWSHLPA